MGKQFNKVEKRRRRERRIKRERARINTAKKSGKRKAKPAT